MAVLELTGIVQPTGTVANLSVTGFRVRATVTRALALTPGEAATVDLVSTGSGVVDAAGAFRFAVGGDGEPKAPVTVTVSTPEGVQVHRTELTLEKAANPINLRVTGLDPLVIEPAEDVSKGGRLTLTGRVIDESGKTIPANLPVVLWGVDADDTTNTPQPIIVTQTQSSGYFSADWVSTTLKSAFGRIAGSAPVVIQLDDAGRLPRRVLLVLELPEAGVSGEGGGAPLRNPDPADLTSNPAEFSQDLGGGCIDLNTPNRAIEEFIYTLVVRTSEPEVRGITLGPRRTVPRGAFAQLFEAATLQEVFATGRANTERAADFRALNLDVDTAKYLLVNDQPPTIADIKRASWLSEISWLKDLIGGSVLSPPVRQPLDAEHPIDWDETPTIFQAITIARGHILEFREVWRADGYSLGDLLQSLPLAPGERRRVAIVDWERRSRTAREESLEFEEQLNAFVRRDRDVSEIVGSRLSEEVAAGSSNTTWGVAGGIGAGFIGSGFGIFGGVAGSHGGSRSRAWQDSARSFSGNSMQSLRDRVMQRSSAVRDQRSTVVQSVSQGETLRAETETVANYNRCHAMTVEYFEVLRHFLITHEMADVRECLFVPLPISQFDRAKALRWQTPLVAHLRDRNLLAGFDATRRIADNWEGWDYPLSRYSEEAPEFIEGELRISFILPRPRDKEDGAFQIDEWKPYRHWLWMDPYELWTQMIQEGIADMNAKNIARRDRQFRQKVAPEIAKRVVDRLRFWYVTQDGSEVEAPLDASLVSRYAEETPLYVSLRPRGGLPPIAREDISQFKVTLDTRFMPPFNIPLDVLPTDAQVIVTSGKARYQTQHKQFVLFNDERILNDLSDQDAVFIPTPTHWAETRNPREEDVQLSDRLIAHLNESLEYYHQVIWMWLDPERRFMFLDGIRVPGLGGKSVASVVENRVIGIAGNSMIFPVAPGLRIDPRVNSEQETDLRDFYAADAPPPVRVSVPTRGVYAEAILGECVACEEIDDSRYWRWTEEGMLALPEIEPVDTGTRADDEETLTPTELPKPLVQIQNAPALPAPVGLGEVFSVLAKPDLFTDITGLEGTQKNARAAFDSALSTASAIASQAAGLAKQNIAATNGERMLDRIQQAKQDGLLDPGVAQELSEKVLGTMVGEPDAQADKKADSPVADPEVQDALDKAAQSEKAQIKVSTADESLELSFDGGDTKVGSGAAKVGVLDIDNFIDQNAIHNTYTGTDDKYKLVRTEITTIADLKSAAPAKFAAIKDKFVKPNPADATKYQFFRRLRISYPADDKDSKKVAGKGKLPLVVIVHGQHISWEGGTESRNHDGYIYLQDHLAKLGIISVSVDTNAANYYGSYVEMRALLVIEAIEKLSALSKEKGNRFLDRIDFDRIGLMGHSRGGDAVAAAAILNKGNKHGVIKAVALVATSDITGCLADLAGRNSMDSSVTEFTFVLYGGLDADMSGEGGARAIGGTGFRHYDRAAAPKAMAYVPLCNHNRFNRIWTDDDDGMTPTDIARLHSRPDHETLLKEYVGALFEWKLLDVKTKATFFTGMSSNSLGHDVSLQWIQGDPIKLVEDFEKVSGTLGTRTVKSAEVAIFADVKVAGSKLEPNIPHQTSILAVNDNITGTAPNVLELQIASTERNWSGFEQLNINLGTWMDVTSQAKINAGNGQPPFEVILINGEPKTGKVSSVSFSTPFIPGKPVFHEIITQKKTLTLPEKRANVSLYRLATVGMALSGFGIKLDDVRTLQILPTAGFKQRVFIDSIWLVKL